MRTKELGMRTWCKLLLAGALWGWGAIPASAAVVITFWSHELGNSFPHAFFTLRGVPDAGGPAVDATFGFTAKTLSPALLFGPVAGKIDIAHSSYIAGSDAQFSVIMTDRQYADVLALVDAWSEGKPDSVYRVGNHNCVSFVKEAAWRVGLTGLDKPALMKRPRSYLKAIEAENSDRITVVEMHGKAYLKTLSPITEGSMQLRPSTRPSPPSPHISVP